MKIRYNSSNQLNLSQLIDGYELPMKYKATASTVFRGVYSWVSSHYSNSKVFKKHVVDGLNTITFLILSDESMPNNWSISDPFSNLPLMPGEDELEDTLGEFLLTVDSICWDVDSTSPLFPETVTAIEKANQRIRDNTLNGAHSLQFKSNSVNKLLSGTKSNTDDIYEKRLELQPSSDIDASTASSMTLLRDVLLDPGYPYFPRIDMKHPWLVGVDKDGVEFSIPKGLPAIPQKQSDICLTTEVNTMTSSELLKLYPDHIMQLRHEEMYKRHEGYDKLEYDDSLGVIFPVPGFTREQVIDNIIKYPDIINIGPGRKGKRRGGAIRGDESVWAPFESMMEIDGELVKVDQALWETLPELKCMPPNRAFQQEYVVRKYLLERDNDIPHTKEMYGTLYPFITLFMPADEYIRRGYRNVDEIVIMCVKSRVSYYRSRSPILERLGLKYNYDGELISQ